MGSNNSGQNGLPNDDKGKDCNYLGSGDYSPEKAVAGGSTPPWPPSLPKDLVAILRVASSISVRIQKMRGRKSFLSDDAEELKSLGQRVCSSVRSQSALVHHMAEYASSISPAAAIRSWLRLAIPSPSIQRCGGLCRQPSLPNDQPIYGRWEIRDPFATMNSEDWAVSGTVLVDLHDLVGTKHHPDFRRLNGCAA